MDFRMKNQRTPLSAAPIFPVRNAGIPLAAASGVFRKCLSGFSRAKKR
jgi:hypothetical protein